MPFACKAPRTVSALSNAKGGLALLFQRPKVLRRHQKVTKQLQERYKRGTVQLATLNLHYTCREALHPHCLPCGLPLQRQWTYKPPFLSTAPSWTLFDRVRGIALYAAMITFVAVPIWIAQGFLALLGVTLG